MIARHRPDVHPALYWTLAIAPLLLFFAGAAGGALLCLHLWTATTPTPVQALAAFGGACLGGTPGLAAMTFAYRWLP